MIEGDELWATLARTPSLDAPTLRALALRLADDAALSAGCALLLTRTASELTSLGVKPRAAAWLTAPRHDLINADLAARERHGLQLLPSIEPLYPAQLAQQAGAPPVLWLRGSAAVLSRAQLAIVGTRNPTATGRSTAYDFSAYCTRGGLLVTSGLALGIDAAAHQGALASGGATVAVCGTGLARCYPREHLGLAEHIVAAGGALVSELPPDSPPASRHFPDRNRILSGLSRGVLVVEAARRSGSLITARHAGEQGREVFAIPGSIHNPLSRGCHQLLRDGATLVESAAEVFLELNIPDLNQRFISSSGNAAAADVAAQALDKGTEILLHAVAFEPTSVDTLAVRTGLASQLVVSMLLLLELEGKVAPQPGGRYIRLRGDAVRPSGVRASAARSAPTNGKT